MKSFEFTIVAGGLPTEGDDWHDRFHDAGCDDALLALQRGLFVLHFDREADDLRQAIESACADVRRAGADVVRVEPDPLVSASDVAERANVTRQAVSLWANGERSDAFPKPVACVSGSRPLWRWSDVARWLHGQDRLTADTVEAAVLIEEFNVSLTSARPRPVVESVPETIAPEISAYARIEHYLRRPIGRPALRTTATAGSERHRSGFVLRTGASIARTPHRMTH